MKGLQITGYKILIRVTYQITQRLSKKPGDYLIFSPDLPNCINCPSRMVQNMAPSLFFGQIVFVPRDMEYSGKHAQVLISSPSGTSLIFTIKSYHLKNSKLLSFSCKWPLILVNLSPMPSLGLAK